MLTLLSTTPAQPTIIKAAKVAQRRSPSWTRAKAPRFDRHVKRVELAPGVAVLTLRRWSDTSVLDTAPHLPWDENVTPVKREFPFPEWHREARCVGMADEIFFGPDTLSPAVPRGMLREAREICRRCPVARDCLTQALTQPETHGVWAGTSGLQRVRLIERLHAGEDLQEVITQCLTKLSRMRSRRRRRSPYPTVIPLLPTANGSPDIAGVTPLPLVALETKSRPDSLSQVG